MQRRWTSVAIICLVSAPAIAADMKANVEQTIQTWESAFNKHDAAPIGNLVSADVIYVPATGVMTQGRENLLKTQEEVLKAFPDASARITAEKVETLGDDTWAVGQTVFHTADKDQRFHWSSVYALEGGQLKVKLLSVGPNLPPPPMHPPNAQK
jgi:uncharacterized protein (TIGR02246 family)